MNHPSITFIHTSKSTHQKYIIDLDLLQYFLGSFKHLKEQIDYQIYDKMKFTALIFAALPAATSAWASFSIAQGLPIRRSVAKFTDDKVPEDAVTKAAEGKRRDDEACGLL